MPRWQTPDAAIREAVMLSPLRGRGIDYARVPTTSEAIQGVHHDHSQVLAAFGKFEEREQQVLVGWALGLSYRRMAALMQLSDRTVRRLHRPAWERMRKRLQELDLIPREEAVSMGG